MSKIIIESEIASFALALQTAGTVERSHHEKAYLKSNLDFYGTPVPAIRKISKNFRKVHPELAHAELVALVEALWQSTYHEMRSLGIGLLDCYPHLLTTNDLELFETLLRQMNTWAHVDWIATGAIAQLLHQDSSVKTVLMRWSTDDSFWIRRTAMLALMKRARFHRDDFDLFAQFASQMVQEQEFFIRKAIGWVLREVSKHHSEWTYEFLTQHIHVVSGLTLREGAKYLPPPQRETLMEQYKNRKQKRQ